MGVWLEDGWMMGRYREEGMEWLIHKFINDSEENLIKNRNIASRDI